MTGNEGSLDVGRELCAFVRFIFRRRHVGMVPLHDPILLVPETAARWGRVGNMSGVTGCEWEAASMRGRCGER